MATAIKRFSTGLHTIETCEYHLDKDYFGEDAASANNAIPGCNFSILEVIGDALFSVKNLDEVITNPLYNTNENDQHVITNFVSANLYKELYDKVAEKHAVWTTEIIDGKEVRTTKGKDKHGRYVYPLCISFTMDKTTLNTTKNVSGIPFCIYINNFIKSEYKIHFVGMIPLHLGFSNHELDAILKRQGCNILKMRKSTIAMARRKQFEEMLKHILDPFLKLEKCGMLHQLGHGANDQKPEKCVGYPRITFSVGKYVCVFSVIY